METEESLDVLFLTYHASRITVEDMLRVIGEQGFDAEVKD